MKTVFVFSIFNILFLNKEGAIFESGKGNMSVYSEKKLKTKTKKIIRKMKEAT